MMIDIILFCISVLILHELGHYLAYMFTPFKPYIKIKWFGLEVGSKGLGLLKVIELIFIAWTGILMGFIPFFIFGTPDNWILIYLLTSAIDITIIITLLGQPIAITILDVNKRDMNDMERDCLYYKEMRR
jgi:hypothetical protein